MQICRRIHSQLSSGTEPSPIPGALTAPSTLHKCGYRILLEICESLSHYCNSAIGQTFIISTDRIYCQDDFTQQTFEHLTLWPCNFGWLESWFCICVCSASPVSKRDVLPGGRSVLCLQGVPESPSREQSSTQGSSSSTGDTSLQRSSEQNHLTANCSTTLLNQDPPGLFYPCASHNSQIV